MLRIILLFVGAKFIRKKEKNEKIRITLLFAIYNSSENKLTVYDTQNVKN